MVLVLIYILPLIGLAIFTIWYLNNCTKSKPKNIDKLNQVDKPKELDKQKTTPIKESQPPKVEEPLIVEKPKEVTPKTSESKEPQSYPGKPLIVEDRNFVPETIRRRPIEPPTYDDLLKDDKWKAKANKIKQRDGFRCVYCQARYNLQVHHKYYSRYPNGEKVMPWNYPDDALITLCENCHKKVHQKRKIKLYYRKYNDNYE